MTAVNGLLPAPVSPHSTVVMGSLAFGHLQQMLWVAPVPRAFTSTSQRQMARDTREASASGRGNVFRHEGARRKCQGINGLEAALRE